MHRLFRVYTLWTPHIARLMRETGETHILDLCAGGGGPTLCIVQLLREQYGLPVTVQLTDLFPNRTVLERINSAGVPGVCYLEEPVDATAVSGALGGIRTMFAGFHHMPAAAARAILADVFHKRRPLCVFEGTDNSAWAVLCHLIGIPLITWGVTPFTRPRTLDRLLLTYALPVVPALVTWDGMASSRRTYSVAELRAMTADLQADDYGWDIGYLHHPLVPYRLPYLVGQPIGR
jgi:hypothetical protein